MNRPTLPAMVDPLVRSFLADQAAVSGVLACFGSPVNVVFPQVFSANLESLRSVLHGHGVPHRIHYAHKANQSAALVRTAERAGIGVDVASVGELASAYDAGFDPTRIEATGPKGEAFLRDLVARGVTINVDNAWELQRIVELADGRRVPILVRVCGFAGADLAPSRFGIPVKSVAHALEFVSRNDACLDLRGFAFHLDSGEVRDRLRAADACLSLIGSAYERGLRPVVLDIGGGFRQVFTADADAFEGYVHVLREGLAGRGEPMSWGGNAFGYRLERGAVRGTPVFHKYGNVEAAPAMLDDLLDTQLQQQDRTLAQEINDNLLELWLEPGKALVDHAGITVASVEFVKETADGSVLVSLDISRDNVTPADQEVMVDPIVIDHESWSEYAAGPAGVYLAGRLCLERDFVSAHRIWLARRPRPGDIVVFPNTAAYHMDLSAASASMTAPPPKLAVTGNGGRFSVCSDQEFRP